MNINILKKMSYIRVNSRYNTFISHLNNSSIEDYFGIINQPNKNLKFTTKREGEDIYFEISFLKSYNIDINMFPKEINNIISSYASDFINIRLKIQHLDCYPFKAPLWSLLDVLYNIKLPLNLNDYYNYIVKNHNDKYNSDWSPAISIEKDILEFIQKINHFDTLLEYKLFDKN